MSSRASDDWTGSCTVNVTEDNPQPKAGKSRNINASTANAIDAHMMELSSFAHLDVGHNHGTVLAVVTFPKGDKTGLNCNGEPWRDVQLRMSYDKLMSLGSAKIQDLFAPRAQARFRRRLGFEHALPPGIEYVVDFTPPSEGPELADLTAALWLPRVVKLWFLAGQYLPEPVLGGSFGLPTRPLADKAVGPILALGHDDICRNIACMFHYDEWLIKPNVPGIVEDDSSESGHIPPWRKVDDYCPVRHCAAIVRVLRAINGDSLLLNSAVRLWTVARVAISLDVPQVVVDPVTQWLVAPPNTKFIEICPERAFQLAYELRIPSVLITSFKILVNELAIDYASSKPVTRHPPLTWAQRRRDDYGDYPSDPVEYASRAFAERIGETVEMLQSDDVFSRFPRRLPEWEKLRIYGNAIEALPSSAPLREAYGKLTAALVSVFRKWVNDALDLDTLNQPLIRRNDLFEAQRRHYIPAAEIKPLLNLYLILNPTQKALTPFFWDSLSQLPTAKVFMASTVGVHTSLNSVASTFNEQLSHFIHNAIDDPVQPIFLEAVEHAAIAMDLMPNVVFRDHLSGFNINHFYDSLCREVRQLCAEHLPPRWSYDENERNEVPLFLSDHLLLSLNEKELNYLPIWADGLDDGSGGVFQEVIPPAEMGPSEPGPGYHTGYTVGVGTDMDAGTVGGARSMSGVTATRDGRGLLSEQGDGDDGGEAASTIFAPSDLGVAELRLGSERTSEWVSSVVAGTTTEATGGRSLDVQRSGVGPSSTATSHTRGRSEQTPSESFTAGGLDEEDMYAEARYAQPAAHQAQGQAIVGYVDEAAEVAEAESAPREGAYSDEDMELDLSGGSSTLDGFEEVDMEEAR
ncbi:hypothetical protein P885DRAFT_27441 [Corynascus similis CBS 632.67]